MTSVDSLGRVRIMSVSVPGGKSRTLVYADNPLVQGYRYGFDVKHGTFYLPLLDRKSDVWVAEVVLR
jgi:hypothetical protein